MVLSEAKDVDKSEAVMRLKAYLEMMMTTTSMNSTNGLGVTDQNTAPWDNLKSPGDVKKTGNQRQINNS